MPPGDMTPLHVHKKQSQTTYLLEGDVKLRLPDRARICGPGDVYTSRPAFPTRST
jgi:uncharacterized cupin superfamily protein